MKLPTAMSFGNAFEGAPEIRVRCNIGSLFDLPNCELVIGKWGNTLLNGGLWSTDAIVGPNNSFKSTLSKHKMLSVMDIYGCSTALTLDTEISGTGARRYEELAQHFTSLKDYDFTSGERWRYMTNAEVYGDVWWAMVKEYCQSKFAKENKKANTLTTPFVDRNGEYITALIPTVLEIDSISQLSAKQVEEKYNELDASDGKRNMEDMASAKAKSKIVRDMPVLTASSGTYVITTAHVGEKKDLDPYNPSMQKFQMMKGNRTVKYIPEAFQFNMNNLYEIISAKPLLNATTRGPEYPKVPGDEFKGDMDLMELTINILRGKGGSSGLVFPLLCSQSDGVLPSLSDFYLVKMNKFGIGGNDRNYFIELYPDCSLSRTTVREKIDNDPKLRRALRLQADLLLLQMVHKTGVNFPRERICEPKELYEDLKLLGYDWNELLDTVNEWHFREEAQEKPTLTIYDLLNMRAGVYKPYWKTEEWKKSKPKGMEP